MECEHGERGKCMSSGRDVWMFAGRGQHVNTLDDVLCTTHSGLHFAVIAASCEPIIIQP